ncbi:protein tweety homolog 3-like isoform X1 [Acropora muricata]|uniref:protein tweety homolog 3-like isoform X1 n=1 Tax=Acropora muricata TaxID=159855 RepID=UPI0034E4C8F1
MESSPNCSAGVFNNPSSVAEFFHSFRHLNGRFHKVSSIFIPTFRDYRQALFLYAIGPCIFGGLVFIIFCVYYVRSCCFCYKLHRPREKCAVALRRIVLLTCVLLSGSVIAGFVFNGSVRQGVRGVMTAVGNVNNTLVDTQAKINSIKDNLVDLDRNLGELKSCAKVTHHYRFIIHSLQGFMDDIIGLVARIKKVDLPPFEEYVQEKENYRWWITLGILCTLTLFCVLTFFSVLKGSRRGLRLGMIVGTFSVLLIWFSVGVDLALSVAMSDLCEQPKETLYHYIKDKPVLKGIVRYYIECPIHERDRDQKYADKAESILKVAISAFSILNKLMLPQDCREKVEKCHTDLTKTTRNMVGIIKNLDCKYPHQEFKSANCFVCEGVVNGIAWLLLTSLIIGIFLVVILSLVLPIYLRIPKRGKQQTLLDLCGSDSPIEPPYQPIPEDDNPTESVRPMSSAPMPTTYNSMNRQASVEVHSSEESRVPLLTPNDWLPTPGSSALVNPASSQ